MRLATVTIFGVAAKGEAETRVEFGLPDFRGNEGFWNTYRPIKDHEDSIPDFADPVEFTNNLAVAWGFIVGDRI